MNVVDEYSRVRVTLGFAAKNYGFEVVPAFASEVTVTSIAHDVRQVHPGCLFVPLGHVDRRQLEAARDAGAYAALVPPEFRNEAVDLGIPLLVSSANPVALGKLACDINCDPSSCVATFAVAGDDDDEIHANVLRLADFLHMLGNPVGVISDAGSSSLQRELSLEYPLNIADVQHTLSVCAEDGAAAVVIALNSATLSKNALQSVNIDVLGAEKSQVDDDSKSTTDATTTATTNISFYSLRQRYGFSSRDHSYCVTRSTESDELAQLADEIGGQNIKRHLSLAIAMVLAAGVRRGTIKSALRVSHELR
ncbi:UDP-N-acetylmuramyl peptide synthase [Gardnerella vaginalis]|uniref:UDP-N-acetylmuramyl peptide synthase n=1 Tax=Gardnerella vaginalis TaxID=2702 RepID=UPI001FF1F1B0|nr:UDP-N-acetylmuramyl peptide synthase [Gardnerella vaginalis]